MNKIKAFISSIGSFFRMCWLYPTTPIENFQDAITQYQFKTDPELIESLENFERAIQDHIERNKDCS